jgi:NTF2 fold immunity protein
MKFAALLIVAIFVAPACALEVSAQPPSVVQENAPIQPRWFTEGYVPDQETAQLVALVILRRFYGDEPITRQQPFSVSLNDGIWTIEGSLPTGWAGGVATIKIAKYDGRILTLSHSR